VFSQAGPDNRLLDGVDSQVNCTDSPGRQSSQRRFAGAGQPADNDKHAAMLPAS
jgi:hypothetical protein